MATEQSKTRHYLHPGHQHGLKWPLHPAETLTVSAGLLCLALSPLFGPAAFTHLWAIEPLAYLGAATLITGLLVTTARLSFTATKRHKDESAGEQQTEKWQETTSQFFELFDHDLGRPLRRITGKERETRATLKATGTPEHTAVQELLDEIVRQTLNFRLMMSNIQVLVHLEGAGTTLPTNPVEPSEVVHRIANRYFPIATESGKDLAWWAEPDDFGIVHSNSHAIEHIVTNLVDNAVTHATRNVDISLTRDSNNFHIQVRDDGPGIAPQYLEYLFERGWTPELARREEKSSSGLGLYIARTLARNCGGDLTANSVPGHHTAFLLSLPLNGAPKPPGSTGKTQ